MAFHTSSEEWPSGAHSRFNSQGLSAAATAATSPIADKMSPLTDRIGEFMGTSGRKASLPMYKEKPYHYPPSHRKSGWLQKRRLGAIALTVIAVLYWFGVFSSSSSSADSKISPIKDGKTTVKSKNSPKSAKFNGDWTTRQAKVKEAFLTSWKGYEKYAWGYDEYHPQSKTNRYMVPGGLGWIIVDALDTLMLMNLTDELVHARDWMSTSLSYDKDHDINTFETTIRMLGGLLSAHYLSTEFPEMAPVKDKLGQDMYIEKAVDLADRLTFAYSSKSGVPFASVNPGKRVGIVSHDDGGASSTAEATTVQLEMKYLSKLTGEALYWQKAERVMQVIDDNGAKDGLVPIYIYADQGTFRGSNIRLGSRGDSYYEYLIKQYLQTDQKEDIYRDMWDQALKGIDKHLLTYTKHSNLTIIGERPNGLDGELSPKMDHLVCFMPGTIALGATLGLTLADARKSDHWTYEQEHEFKLAEELMKTCWGMYKVTATGLAPEIAHFHIDSPPRKYTEPDYEAAFRQQNDKNKQKKKKKTQKKKQGKASDDDDDDDLSNDPDALWRRDYDIHSGDRHNLLRPETVESLFYMWRITGDIKYREWGWEMFQAFEKHARISDDVGFASVADVESVPATSRDNMESFWLAETLKYFYLLFGPDTVLPLDKVVFNTEAHPFPVFDMGKILKTGWQRQPRGTDGLILKGEALDAYNKEHTSHKSDKDHADDKAARVSHE